MPQNTLYHLKEVISCQDHWRSEPLAFNLTVNILRQEVILFPKPESIDQTTKSEKV